MILERCSSAMRYTRLFCEICALRCIELSQPYSASRLGATYDNVAFCLLKLRKK